MVKSNLQVQEIKKVKARNKGVDSQTIEDETHHECSLLSKAKDHVKMFRPFFSGQIFFVEQLPKKTQFLDLFCHGEKKTSFEKY